MLYNFLLAASLSLLLILKGIKVIDIEYILIVVNFLALLPVAKSAFLSLKKKEVSVDLLAVVALLVSFIAKEWSSAAFINLMLTFARIFSEFTQKRTHNAIKTLLKYKVDHVNVQTGHGVISKKAKDVKVGDKIIIVTGQRIAVDGQIIEGQASINESNLTGESIPRSVQKGDLVYASTLNVSGKITVKATKREEESALANLILAVEKASLEKSKTITLVSKFASYYIILTFVGAIFSFAITRNVDFVLSLLLVVCADDIALSIPLGFTLAITRAAKSGILVKSSDVLEKISDIKIFLTDKTGTLTKSKIAITKIVNISNLTDTELKKIMSQISFNSDHPINRALQKYCGKAIQKNSNIKIKEFPGEGLSVNLNHKKYLLGNIDFLKKSGAKTSSKTKGLIDQYTEGGYSITALAQEGQIIAMVIFEDEVKTNSKQAILKTRNLGIEKWIMLTGDNKNIAKKIAQRTGVDEYEYGLTPEAKLKEIKLIKNRNKDKLVGMVGDGVNDAPALSLADVSFSMGSLGSDTAIEVSDVAIMDDDLDKIPRALVLGKKLKDVIYQNFAIWGVTNAIGLVLVITGVFSPTSAAAYNFLTDFISTFNVFKLLRSRI